VKADLAVHCSINLFEELGVCISRSPREVGCPLFLILKGVIKGVPGWIVVRQLVGTEVVGGECDTQCKNISTPHRISHPYLGSGRKKIQS
jgi:hypothetical protein